MDEGRKKVLILHERHPDIVGVCKAMGSILIANDISVRVRCAYYDVQLGQYDKVILVVDTNDTHEEYLSNQWYENRDKNNNITIKRTKTYNEYRKGNNRSALRHRYESEEAQRLLKGFRL